MKQWIACIDIPRMYGLRLPATVHKSSAFDYPFCASVLKTLSEIELSEVVMIGSTEATYTQVDVASVEDFPTYRDVEHEIIPVGIDPVRASVVSTPIGPLTIHIELYQSRLWSREIQHGDRIYLGLIVPPDDPVRFNSARLDHCALVSWHGLKRTEWDYLATPGTRNYMIETSVELARERGWSLPPPGILPVRRKRAKRFANDCESIVARAREKGFTHPLSVSNDLLDALDQMVSGALYRHASSHSQPESARVRQKLVQATADYLKHHGSDDKLTGAQLSKALGVPARTLYAAFESHLGVGPNQLQTIQRLYRLRTSLRRHTPETASVSQLMHDAGFSHLGRTSGLYRIHFGEKPVQTLKFVS